MMPLTMAKAGETVTVRRISGKDEVRSHLAELGFVVDSDVTAGSYTHLTLPTPSSVARSVAVGAS